MNPKLIKTPFVLATALLISAVASGQQPTVKRTVLQQVELASIAGREAVTAKAEFPVGGSTGLHTHPGDEVSYVLEGTLSVEMDGASKTYKAGETFFIPNGKPHNAKAMGGQAVVIANYLVEKGKPVTTPVK